MQSIDTVIIGGSQAGLAMGYYLREQGRDFVILDAAARVGDAWRHRWDSLRLFTPARYSGLPGMPFPAEPEHLPSKDDVAAYLEQYATRFSLPVHLSSRVTRVQRVGQDYIVETESQGSADTTHSAGAQYTAREYAARNVIIATGPFQTPKIPRIAGMPSHEMMQLHSSAYRNPAQIPGAGRVVVAGGGNSGVQIASELARVRPVTLAISQKLTAVPQRFLGRSIFWWLDRIGAMAAPRDSRMGRRMRSRELLIGESADSVARDHGVQLMGRVADINGARVTDVDGVSVDAEAVIWATGYSQSFGYINVPVFDEKGGVIQQRGVTAADGLYFLGLPWMHTRGSALIGWVWRDAMYLAGVLAQRGGVASLQSRVGPI